MRTLLCAMAGLWLLHAPAWAQQRGLEDIPPANLGVRRYHAVLFAESDYANDSGMRDLRTPSTDVTEIASLLEDQYGFTTEILENQGRTAMIAKLDSLRDPRVIGPDDVLVIYYAGHGVLDAEEGRGYWLPVDAQQSSTANWISTDDVGAKVRAMRARHVLVIADSCFSAALVRSGARPTSLMRSGGSMLSESVARRVVAKKSRRVLSSGGLEAVSDIGMHGMSPFAYSLFHLLQDARDPFVNPAQLATALLGTVGKSGQTPVFGTLAGTEGLADPGYPILINRRGVYDAPSPLETTAPPIGSTVSATVSPAVGRPKRPVLRGIGIGLGVIGAASLLTSIPLDAAARRSAEEEEWARHESTVALQRATVVTGYGALGLGAVLVTTTFVIK